MASNSDHTQSASASAVLPGNGTVVHSSQDFRERVSFLLRFFEFTSEDAKIIHLVSGRLSAMLPSISDAVYRKLFSFPETKEKFFRKTGQAEAQVVEERRHFLELYLTKLLMMDYNDCTSWRYFEDLARRHTSDNLFVEYQHMGAVLGYLQNLLVPAIMTLQELDLRHRCSLLQALTKVLWIQNDMIACRYME